MHWVKREKRVKTFVIVWHFLHDPEHFGTSIKLDIYQYNLKAAFIKRKFSLPITNNLKNMLYLWKKKCFQYLSKI